MVYDNGAIRKALVSCLHYLVVEQGWEWFRAEMLYFDDSEKQTASERNAESLRQFVRDLAKEHPAVAQCVNDASRLARGA